MYCCPVAECPPVGRYLPGVLTRAWVIGSTKEKRSMSGVFAYFLMLGAATGVAIGLYFGLKAVKLI